MDQEAKVIMLGTGAPVPNLERMPSAELLIMENIPILIDCGEGATTQIMKAGFQPQDIHHLFFTHLHCDHMLGYGQFLIGGWTLGRKKLTVYGPKGTRDFHEAVLSTLRSDVEYRKSLGRSPEGILDVEIIEIEDAGLVNTSLPIEVTCEEMVHYEPTFAYRFQTKDKAVVFSGDTSPVNALVQLSEGADVIVHECCLTSNSAYEGNDEQEHRIWESLQREHCTPQQAAETAKKAGVSTLITNHFLPDINERQVYDEIASVFNGNIIVSEDLQEIKL
ncbi:Ribonuclease BN, tRNA processing enzyme [Alteribacillus persepolensis]|uniref:Ribonuclease BN, tRNA processing enzyme n=1 Tax=Alteribacillus persepolensis TaxID=568899 RepID=A0A1G8A7M8_9BACI|nr:MBL fold metallo-hydrolase [Alteribacillus persepolensis]SDH16942.1 Ribonuclease BN, tRNA processing enzyme [Alteribacillus persepolensis]